METVNQNAQCSVHSPYPFLFYTICVFTSLVLGILHQHVLNCNKCEYCQNLT